MLRIKSRVKKKEQKIIQKLVIAKDMKNESLKPRIWLKRNVKLKVLAQICHFVKSQLYF